MNRFTEVRTEEVKMEDSRFKWSEETKETDFQLFTSNIFKMNYAT